MSGVATQDSNDDRFTLFRATVDLLDSLGRPYWLDQGSLLGVVRDGHFLSWDHDIDLGMWESDLEAIRHRIEEGLFSAAAIVSSLPCVIKTRTAARNGVAIPVNIRVYRRHDGYAYSEFWSVMKPRPRINRRLRQAIRFFGRRIARAHAAGNAPSAVTRRLFSLALRWREGIKTRRITFRVSEAFFDVLERRTVYEISVPVPADPERYLALKYGETWRVPNADWVWWKEDGALYRTEHVSGGYQPGGYEE